MNIIGLDIGGSKIGIGVVRLRRGFKVLSYEKIVTGENLTAKKLVALIEASIKKYISSSVAAIGVGIAGQVDFQNGVVRHGPNLPTAFDNLRLRSILEKKFKLPVVIDNDVHCFALAEALHGAGRGHGAIFGITIGTGVGGGLVMNGKIDRGATNTVGEIGHLSVGGDALCSCGKKGHVEAYAGGRRMMARYEKLTGKNLKALDLENLYKKGDKNARMIVNEAATALAASISNALVLMNPDCIVIGGGLSRFPELIALIKKQIPELLPFPILKKTPILISKLGDQAGVVGAALLIRSNYKNQASNIK